MWFELEKMQLILEVAVLVAILISFTVYGVIVVVVVVLVVIPNLYSIYLMLLLKMSWHNQPLRHKYVGYCRSILHIVIIMNIFISFILYRNNFPISSVHKWVHSHSLKIKYRDDQSHSISLYDLIFSRYINWQENFLKLRIWTFQRLNQSIQGRLGSSFPSWLG